MTTLKFSTSREWLDRLTELAKLAGEPSKAAYLERLVAEDAARRGEPMPGRVPPSRFNPWIDAAERAAAG